MMTYKVRILKKARKGLAKIPKNYGKQIRKKIFELAHNPKPAGSKKLKGKFEGHWTIRIGDYRVIYNIEEEILIILVIEIAHRKDIYRKI